MKSIFKQANKGDLHMCFVLVFLQYFTVWAHIITQLHTGPSPQLLV